MHRYGKFLIALIVLVFGCVLMADSPASAQPVRPPTYSVTGEPTNPEGAIALLNEAEEDPEEYGVSGTAPQSEEDVDSWFDALMDLLRMLGIISTDEEGSGS